MDVATCLSANRRFAALPPAKLDAVAFAFTEIDYPAGELLVDWGDRHVAMRVLLEGEVAVCLDAGGREREVARVRAGELFGLVSLLDRAPACARCRAVGPIRVGELSDTAFAMLSNASADVGIAFQRALAGQIVADFRRLSASGGRWPRAPRLRPKTEAAGRRPPAPPRALCRR